MPEQKEQPAQELYSLDRKYRPRTFDEVVGNELTVRSLKTVLSKPAKPHSYLFVGPSGCGKTTLARIVARELGCDASDYREFDSASYRGIEAIRQLRNEAKLKPLTRGGVKAYLLDEAHQLTRDAQNSLLKLLEEGPRHAYFLLATTDPDKLIGTIKTRCVHVEVRALNRARIVSLLKRVRKAEGFNIDDEALGEIGRVCNGSARQALVILDQVCEIDDPDEQFDAIAEAAGSEYQVIELCRALMKGEKWAYVQKLLKGIQGDPETVRRQIMGYFNSVMLNDEKPSLHTEQVADLFTESFFYSGHLGLTLSCRAATRVGRE